MHTQEDIQLAEQVRKALAAHTVGTPPVQIVAEAGVVTLSGVVPNEMDRRNAVSTAHSVPGVKDVRDHLRLADENAPGVGGFVDDSLITAEVKARLLAEPGISSLSISVETTHGVVMLSGNVDRPEHATVAENVVRKVNGVTRVDNRLVYRP